MRSRSTKRAVCATVLTFAAAIGAGNAASLQAPADQYFGRLKLSYIGINNTLTTAFGCSL